MRNLAAIFGCLFFVLSISAQRGFHFEKKNSKVTRLPFKLVMNVMVVPAYINGIELNLVVDTGANAIFLFNLKNMDSLELKNPTGVLVRGLGSNRMVNAINSKNNTVRIGGLINKKQSLQLILDEQMDFSRRMGMPIHGVIGANLFSNFITEIKYSNEKIKFHKPQFYNNKKLKGYKEIAFEKHNERFFVNTNLFLDEKEIEVEAKLLLDTGSSDSVWIFKDEEKKLCVPENYFDDYIGMGIGGDIYGKRSRLQQIKLGGYMVENSNVSFPDTTHIQLLKSKIGRNGSLGGNLIKRFDLVINPFENKLFLKKNYMFKAPFKYNLSGIEIELAETREVLAFDFYPITLSDKKAYSIEDLIFTKSESIFQIVNLRVNSPAYRAGLKNGDVIISINNKPTKYRKIGEVSELLSFKEVGKEIKVKVSRDGKLFNFKYILESLL